MKSKHDPIDLLRTMAMKDHNSTAAQQAFAIFYKQYKNYLGKVIWSRLAYYPNRNKENVTTIIDNILTKIFHHAHLFDPTIHGKVKKITNDEKVKGWMEGFASNEVKLFARANKINNDPIFNHLELDPDIIASPEITHEDELDAMSPLSKAQAKYIHNTLAEFPVPYQQIFKTRTVTKNEKGEVPPEITKNLEREFGYVAGYQRLITKRVTDKLKAKTPEELSVETIRK